MNNSNLVILNTISSSIVFPKLRNILLQDIETLSKLATKDLEECKLIDSLLDVKKRIIGMLPALSEGNSETAAPPQRLYIEGYEKVDRVQNTPGLASMFFEIEKNQMQFVKGQVSDEGMPDELLEKLEEILDVYENVVDQIDRSVKTGQYNPINI